MSWKLIFIWLGTSCIIVTVQEMVEWNEIQTKFEWNVLFIDWSTDDDNWLILFVNLLLT